MKRITLTFLAALSAAPVFAQTDGLKPAAPLTFDGALRRALEVNNGVEQSRENVAVAEAQRSQLFSTILPRISLNGDLTRNSIQRTFGNGSDVTTILPQNNWSYRVILQQPIFAGLREQRAYSQAKINIENARESTRLAEDATLLRVASSYLAVVNADRRIDIEKRNVELADRRHKQAQAFYDAGEVTKVDVLRAETARKAAQRQMEAAMQNREHAASQLREDLDLQGPLVVEAPAHTVPPMPDEAQLVAKATESRPDVEVAENNLRIANLEIQKQRGFWLPVVTFEGGWINQRSSFPADQYKYGTLHFNVPLFQSGEVQARVAVAKHQAEAVKLQVETVKAAAREDVHTAITDLRATQTSLQLAQEQLQAAQAEYDQAFELYRAQEATSLDVAASETSLADARRAVAEETLNRDLAELRVWFAAGAMKDAVGVTR
ncbi:MAG TPA: TolC family protein [Thermoanaerobaculia bacterium]|nr:TolC family protein [Thermoanaerobaculia bacterium]